MEENKEVQENEYHKIKTMGIEIKDNAILIQIPQGMTPIEAVNQIVQGDQIESNDVSDGYHTFGELYKFRKMYNAALFNAWAQDEDLGNRINAKLYKQGEIIPLEDRMQPEFIPKFNVHKSWKHSDGEYCFGEEKKWFIVSAMLPTGLISNHYEAKDWDLFKIPEVEKALYEYDGHTASDVLERLKAL